HLLEMRHEPLAVDGVTVEAAADEVVHPAERHRVERLRGHLHLSASQEELDYRRRWELRSVPKSAPDRIELLAKRADRVGQERRSEGLPRRLDRAAQLLRNRAGIALDVGAPIAPCVRDGLQQLLE